MSTDNVTNFAAELLQEVDDKIGELKEVLVEKITDEAERLESFEAKLIADQATLENSRSDFESNVKPFADLDENRKNLERNVADLQNRWLELDDEMRHLEAVHQSLDIERDQLKAQHDQLKAQRDQLKAQRDQLKAERKQFNDERDQLKADRKQFDVDSAAFDAARKEFNIMFEKLLADRTVLQTERAKLEAERAMLTSIRTPVTPVNQPISKPDIQIRRDGFESRKTLPVRRWGTTDHPWSTHEYEGVRGSSQDTFVHGATNTASPLANCEQFDSYLATEKAKLASERKKLDEVKIQLSKILNDAHDD